MAKVAIALKVEPEKAAALKKKVAEQGKTVSELLQERLFSTQKADVPEGKIEDVKRENEVLREQLRRVNRKPLTIKRVSVPLTLEEHEKLTRAAFEQKVSRSALLRGMLTGEAPALIVNGLLFF